MPVLRVFNNGLLQVRYDHIVLVQGHFIARQIQVFWGGQLAADLSLDPLGVPNQSPEAILTPPASALKVDLSQIVMNSAGSHFWPMPLKVAWNLPSLTLSSFEAASAGVSATGSIGNSGDLPGEPKSQMNNMKFATGTVVVKLSLRGDGHVQDAEALSGPAQLQPSALEAARQWVFRPVVVMGEARPVVTHISLSVSFFER